MPHITVKAHRQATKKIDAHTTCFRRRQRRTTVRLKREYKMPTCKPESARIWLLPVSAKSERSIRAIVQPLPRSRSTKGRPTDSMVGQIGSIVKFKRIARIVRLLHPCTEGNFITGQHFPFGRSLQIKADVLPCVFPFQHGSVYLQAFVVGFVHVFHLYQKCSRLRRPIYHYAFHLRLRKSRPKEKWRNGNKPKAYAKLVVVHAPRVLVQHIHRLIQKMIVHYKRTDAKKESHKKQPHRTYAA